MSEFALRAIPKRETAVCGWCGVTVSLEIVGDPLPHGPPTTDWRGTEFAAAAFRCPRSECGKQSLLLFAITRDYSLTAPGGQWDVELRGQLPRGVPQPMRGLPSAIENIRREAWSSFYGGDYRASLVMARAAVQRGVRTLGGKGHNIHAEIESLPAAGAPTDIKMEMQALANAGTITLELKAWAHEVRLSAREAAHSEELGDVTKDEAHRSLEFMDAFLEFAIALPQRRAAAKAAAAEPPPEDDGRSDSQPSDSD